MIVLGERYKEYKPLLNKYKGEIPSFEKTKEVVKHKDPLQK